MRTQHTPEGGGVCVAHALRAHFPRILRALRARGVAVGCVPRVRMLGVCCAARLILSSLEQDYQKMVDTGNTSHTDMYSVHAVRLAHR